MIVVVHVMEVVGVAYGARAPWSRLFTREWHIPEERGSQPPHQTQQTVMADCGPHSHAQLAVRELLRLHLGADELQGADQGGSANWPQPHNKERLQSM